MHLSMSYFSEVTDGSDSYQCPKMENAMKEKRNKTIRASDAIYNRLAKGESYYPRENVKKGRMLEQPFERAFFEALNKFECENPKTPTEHRINTGNKHGFDLLLGPGERIAIELKNCSEHYPIFRSWVENAYNSKIKALGFVPSKTFWIGSGNYQQDALDFMREHNITWIKIENINQKRQSHPGVYHGLYKEALSIIRFAYGKLKAVHSACFTHHEKDSGQRPVHSKPHNVMPVFGVIEAVDDDPGGGGARDNRGFGMDTPSCSCSGCLCLGTGLAVMFFPGPRRSSLQSFFGWRRHRRSICRGE